MAPAEAGAALVRRLLAEVRADRETLIRRHVEVVRYARSGPGAGPERLAALALALDRSYTVLESILERIARTLEGGPALGEDWHLTLLANARLEIPGTRPRILADASWSAADELRRFRHFLRHAYAADLDAARLNRVAAAWIDAGAAIRGDLEGLETFLEALAQRVAGGPDVS